MRAMSFDEQPDDAFPDYPVSGADPDPEMQSDAENQQQEPEANQQPPLSELISSVFLYVCSGVFCERAPITLLQ